MSYCRGNGEPSCNNIRTLINLKDAIKYTSRQWALRAEPLEEGSLSTEDKLGITISCLRAVERRQSHLVTASITKYGELNEWIPNNL